VSTTETSSIPPASESRSSLAELVADHAAQQPGAIAVEDGERRLSYAELDAAAASIAAGLRAAGIGDQEVVGVCLPRSWQTVCAFVGIVRAGAAYVPIVPTHPAERQRELLELAGAETVLTGAGHDGGLPPGPRRLDAEALALAGAGDPPPCAPGGDRLAYVLFTSGSTGVPKGVEITHATLAHMFGCGSPLVPIAGDAVLALAPIEFDLAALETWGALVAGGRLVLAPPGRPDPRAVGRLIVDRNVTYALFAAGLFEQMAHAALPDLGGMRLIGSGGDVMSATAAAAVLAAHPQLRLLNAYGPTETTIIASGFELTGVDGSPVPIGQPLPGYAFYVLGEDGRPVADREPGELWIGGAGVARGYRGDPERTADRFRPDPFATDPAARMYGSGDVVRRRGDGEFEFLGRADHQVKIAGHRVEPGEVEQALGGHPEVRHAAVVARDDVAGHKRLVGFAALDEAAEADERALFDHLAERLPPYMLPATIVILAELPLTARGKVDRAALPEPTRTRGEGAATGTAAVVAETVAELLGLDDVGPDEDIFTLGADSLLAIQLIGRLRDRLQAELAVDAIFQARTPRALAARLDSGVDAQSARPPLLPAHAPGPPPASFAQRRAWLFERMNPDSLAFQFACAIHFEGDLDETALAGALGDLVERHEILRTALVERDGEPIQLVHERVPLPLEVVDLPDGSDGRWERLLRSTVRTRIELDKAPLVRWTLVRRGEGRWSLIGIEHHAIHDGWSFIVVLSELSELYSARVEGRAPNLPPPLLQFGDFAHWERAAMTPELERGQLEYWRGKLDHDPPLLELPIDRPRPQQESFAGGSVRRPVDPALLADVRTLAREEGATSFMACLAAFASLLGRHAGSDDVQVGSGLANRRDPAAERLVGMLVATVALRIDLTDDPTVRELLRRVRDTVVGAMVNADVPFDRVVETLSPQRQAGRSPLVQTLFSFDDTPAAPQSWPGLDTDIFLAVSNGTAKADLNVIGVDHGDHPPFFIWEHSDLFTDATVDRLAVQHQTLLEQFVAHPDARLSELELASAAEREQLRAWSAGTGAYDREATIPGLVERQARRDPEVVAAVEPGAELSYGELLARARAVAGSLRAAGVEPGDRVGILLPRSLDSVAAHLGVLVAGAAYVPLDLQHPAARIARALGDAGATVVLSAGTLGANLPAEIETLDVAAAAAADPLEATAGAGPEDLAYVMYTSGSTGEPKGVEVTHGNVVRLVDAPGFVELGPGTTMLHAASTAFDAATLEIWGPLANGGTIAILPEHPSPDAVAAAVEAHGVTTMWLTAGLFHELVDRRPECLGRVRHLLAGGDVLSPAHVARALEALPAEGRLTNGYGPTETTTFALTHELRPGDEVDGPVPLGRPIQGTTCDVLDAAGKPAPVGMAGELWIGGGGVARGYRGDPELSAERFQPDPERPGGRRYRSGDRVRRRPDGALEFLGRADRQLKVRGVRVEPAEVEAALRAHADLADAAVVADERGPGGVSLVAYVVAAPGSAAPDPAALRAHASARLPAAMVPAAWVALPRLPLTANGKVDHARLPAPSREHLAATSSGRRPRGRTERRVAKAFEAVLDVRAVGAEDDFFALGGHSLLAVELFGRLERIGGRRLALATIFEAPTPRALAACLDGDASASRWDNLVALKPQGSRPPLFIVGAGDGNIVGFGQLARELSAEQPLYILQPSGLDGRHPLDQGIGTMAERYLEKVRSVRPHGPYLLAGRCNGATVAYEMAQRLRAAGEEVPLLISLDSEPPPAGPRELAPGVPYDALMESAWVRARQRGEEVPDLDAPGGAAAMLSWLREPVGPGVSRYLLELHAGRADLGAGWTDPLGVHAPWLAAWAWEHGIHDSRLQPRLLQPVVTDGCRPPGQRHSWDTAMATVWEELGREPADPLSPAAWKEFHQRLTEPLAGTRMNRYLLTAWERPDLTDAFPEPLGADAERMIAWAWSAGIDEEGLAPAFLPPSSTRLPTRRRAELAGRSARTAAVRAGARGARRGREIGAEARARAVDAVERGLKRPLPGARERTEREVVAAARKARATYRAEPWPGRVVLVTSPEFAEKPAYAAWGLRAEGGVDHRPLPVGHVEMLRGDGAKLLAACLEDCVEAVLDDPSRPGA
jgi:amino acid adenylation domain-containing protein